MKSVFSPGRAELIEWKETAMHDFVVGILFIAVVMAPCVVALTANLDDRR